MNRYLKILGLGILLSLPWVGAQAQQANQYWCTSGTVPCPPSGWVPASTANPMPVTVTNSSSGAEFVQGTGAAGAPLGGVLSIQGTQSNASSGVASTSSNVPAVGYNYCWNGTTWDQCNTILTGPQALANTLPTNLNSQYPVNAVTIAPTPVGAVAVGTTGAVVATYAATANVTNFLCEYNVSVIGSAVAGTVTIAGLNGGTRVVNLTAVAAGSFLKESFSPCIPASAANTAITITSSAFTAATANDVNSSGYRL